MLSRHSSPVWDDGRAEALPTLAGAVVADWCVVGLGGSGLTAVLALLDRGQTVVGIDAIDVGAGAAGRNGGFLLAGCYDFYHDAVARHGHDRALAIYRATLEEMSRIAEEAPGTVRWTGSRRVAASPWEVEDCRAQMAAMQADGLPVTWLEDAQGAGLFFPQDAAFQPLARCRLLAHRARARGAQLFGGTPLVALDGTTVMTPSGQVQAQRVLIAVDGYLERLLPELAGRVRTARLQMLATAPTAEVTIPSPMYYREGFEYWQQLPDGRIALGGFRDQGGEAEWSHDAVPGEPVQSLLETFLRTHIGVSAPITHRWAACAGYTETGLPIVEQVRPGVFAMGGYSGTGNVMGALCARAVVALACDGDPSVAERSGIRIGE